MNIPVPEPRCSKCKSTNVEHVRTMQTKGFRCRSCGHEKIKEDPAFRQEPSRAYVHQARSFEDF